MKIIRAENLNPICPHCEKELEVIIRLKNPTKEDEEGRAGNCYMCPHCSKVLGFSDHR
jgi:uncharacterized protein with PIN domain